MEKMCLNILKELSERLLEPLKIIFIKPKGIRWLKIAECSRKENTSQLILYRCWVQYSGMWGNQYVKRLQLVIKNWFTKIVLRKKKERGDCSNREPTTCVWYFEIEAFGKEGPACLPSPTILPLMESSGHWMNGGVHPHGSECRTEASVARLECNGDWSGIAFYMQFYPAFGKNL